MTDTPAQKRAHTAAKALSDLNIFYGVIALLEGGTITADSDRGAQKIIKVCKQEARACLARYDHNIGMIP